MKTAASMLVLAGAALTLTGCGPVFHREMLGKSIAEFSGQFKDANPLDKVWITSQSDSGCDCHGDLCKKGGALGGFSFGGGGSSYDGLASEVFANYLTQKKKGRVVEWHKHNYFTDSKVNTHQALEVTEDGKKTKVENCEDLCLLEEAKKRAADKVLAYQIVSMQAEELRIHLRLSDVKTGLVEFSRTLLVQRGVVANISF